MHPRAPESLSFLSRRLTRWPGMTTLFETIPFRLVRRAQTELAAVGGDLPEAVQNQIETLLVAAADPDAALHYLLSLKQQKPAAFEKLVTSAQHLQYLAAVFSN